jgi:hypothetical protein
MQGSDAQAWKKQVTTSDRMRAALQSNDFLFAWLVPSAVYVFLLLLYSYAFMQSPLVCGFFSFVAFAATLVCALCYARRPAMLPLSLSLLVATTMGTLFGLYCYDSYSIYPGFYSNARTYDNVVASERASAVADAGKIEFTSESYVSAKEAAGYITESGTIYCVAPVRDSASAKNIEFWAAGVGCCDGLGTFTCDSAADSDAHSGAVIFQGLDFFTTSRLSYYQKAQAKAMAEYALMSPTDALYVRWVETSNLNMLSTYYKVQAAVFVIVSSAVFVGAFAALAYVMVPFSVLGQAKRPS